MEELMVYLTIAFWSIVIARFIAKKLNLPMVTGYVIFGIIMGGSYISGSALQQYGFITKEVANHFSIVSEIALGMIAFSIGLELEYKSIKKLGKSIVWIVFLEVFVTFVFVSLFTFIYMKLAGGKFSNFSLAEAIIMGAVSSATAPAATVAIINELKASGPLTKTILSVVGIDDGAALIIYSIASAYAKSNLSGKAFNIVSSFGEPLIEILLSIAIGSIVAFVAIKLIKKIKDIETMTFFVGSLIFFILALENFLPISPLLANMSFGAILVNFKPILKNRMFQILKNFGPIFYALFFFFAGTNLDITLLPYVGILGLIYFLSRSAGKISGATLGAYIGAAPSVVKKYIGFSLLPQIGVAVALAFAIKKEFGSGEFGDVGVQIASTIMNILLFTTILTEIIGPILTKWSLKKSGEAING